MIPKVKVFIVDDSIVFRKSLSENLSQDSHIEVIGYGINAFDAKNKIPSLKPDVITLDVEMPGISGIDFLKQLLPNYPIPVILVSSLNLSVFDALAAGAVDFVRKPDMDSPTSVRDFFRTLCSKIVVASNAKVTVPGIRSALAPNTPARKMGSLKKGRLDSMVIAIGASTGGTEATLEVLRNLPEDTPGIVVTQHMPEGFTKMYADRLDRLCRMHVKEAATGDLVRRGHVLIAPGSLQMKVVKNGANYSVRCFPGNKVNGHCPSVEVLFDSVAETAGSNAVGIILTGMGNDGAQGLLHMKEKGAYTIGQDKESCVVYGMPMVAYNIGAVTTQAAVSNIAYVLHNHLSKL